LSVSVTRADVLHVAALARLELSEEEIAAFTGQLNNILDHVAELESADVGDVSALTGASEWPAPLRSDEPGADTLNLPAAALSKAADQGFFTVPRLAALDADALGSGA
jgi:aspartyl-tRNA(Asn)/glutamyl-tRNA(Gln) amidotransferase subunit C